MKINKKVEKIMTFMQDELTQCTKEEFDKMCEEKEIRL